MPHVICEYSANLEKKIQIDALLETLHSAMVRTGAAELGGLRTRADPGGPRSLRAGNW